MATDSAYNDCASRTINKLTYFTIKNRDKIDTISTSS